MTEINCPNECRDDLLLRIGTPVQTASAKWILILFCSIFFGVWGIAYGVYVRGVEQRVEIMSKNSELISTLREQTSSVKSDITHIKKTQDRIENKIEKLLDELSKYNRIYYEAFP